MHLKGKKIILAISGSIAAYKTPELVRQFIKAGADVRVITTNAALDFVSELALATVSKNEVFSNVHSGASWNNHVEMGRWADAMLIAPCSANTLSKLANGLCDNLVCAVYLSAICPVFIAPAMDEDMWMHAATKRNLEQVKSFGNTIIPVAHGELASGLIGEGRMAEPAEIVQHLNHFFGQKKALPLQGKKALVTAGPTFEKIDPVRFIGNYSTGKMGFALAETLAEMGAEVTLVAGVVHLETKHPRIKTIKTESADEMATACETIFPETDITIMAAAVADYKPATFAEQKIKKTDAAFEIKLERTKDILAGLGKLKKAGQLLVGFALETENEMEHARKKLQAKNADLIVLNSLQDAGAGFGHDTNKVTLITAFGAVSSLPLLSKKETAAAIINYLIEMKNNEQTVS